MKEFLFGKKSNFAIEVFEMKDVYHSKLRIWINDKEFTGKLSHELVHAKEDFYFFVENHQELGDKSLSSYLTVEDWIKWMFSKDVKLSKKEQDWRMKFIRFFGDQLDNFSIRTNVLQETIEWHIYDNKKKKNLRFKTERKNTIRTMTEYISWFEQQGHQYFEIECVE